MKILALHLHSFMEYAQLRGVSRREILSVMTTPPDNFLQEATTVSSEDFFAAINFISTSLKDDLLGIRLGNFLNMNSLGLIYQISLQTATIEEALFYLNNYIGNTIPVVQPEIQFIEDRVIINLSINVDKSEASTIVLESLLTIISRELDMMTAQPLDFLLFSPACSPEYPSEWQQGKSFAISFKAALLKASLQDISRLHLDALIPEYLKLIETMKPEPTFSSKVKIASLNMAKPELPALEKIADVFNLTPRTLQRRLSTEQTTFRQIIDDLKKQISYMLLQHNRFSVADVSYVLGYSEPAAFIHSFKKWYGNSPEKVRTGLAVSA
ncbi:helix-turn-helix transcriptional regulator [Xanthocytophaga flava]|uniref:helix-turn-helix transcriptional regulator n=1 Tax=Xanthocytophaga flava TaxID=3048013 RepID=UPI0028D41B41|nr:helix-turn-helix transcriptional regulator [Xanthocytophaga flavus]MDJ1466435.1 helix-turn-helix transcriptional regulator [Xanthocytophaga flavus]